MDFIVPKVLREPIDSSIGDDTLWPMVGMSLIQSGMSLGESLAFLKGAKVHQDRLVHDEEHEDFIVYPGIVREVEIIERRGRDNKDFLVGRKARIHIEGTKGRHAGNIDTIDTEWIEYNGSDVDDYAFFIALSRNIKEEAESLMDKEVFCRKTFLTGRTQHSSSGKIRYISDIWASHSQEAKSKQEEQQSSSRKSRQDQQLSVESLDQLVADNNAAGKVTDELEDKEYNLVLNSIVNVANDKHFVLSEDVLSSEKAEDELYALVENKKYVDAIIFMAKDMLRS